MKRLYGGLFICFLSVFAACKSTPKTDCTANPIPGCACPMLYDPVCGCDGKTYSNECMANCAQIKIIGKGECKK